jgi:medium-chain acyl-[acyl-carrier-protein] hydrolase
MTPASLSNQWILQPRLSRNPALRLFCFPYAGGGASVYNSWIEELPETIEVCPVQLPGRENLRTRAPYSRLSPLIDELANVLGGYLNIPFAFYGHSMGALISFELIRRLRQQHLPQPSHLFVSSHRAPQLADRTSSLHELPDSEFLSKVQELQGITEAVLGNSELIEIFAPLLRADFSLCESYVYCEAAPLECAITCFGGTDDKRISTTELDAWRAQTTSRFKLRLFPGNHFFLQDSRQLLLRVISQDLKDALRPLPRARSRPSS